MTPQSSHSAHWRIPEAFGPLVSHAIGLSSSPRASQVLRNAPGPSARAPLYS